MTTIDEPPGEGANAVTLDIDDYARIVVACRRLAQGIRDVVEPTDEQDAEAAMAEAAELDAVAEKFAVASASTWTLESALAETREALYGDARADWPPITADEFHAGVIAVNWLAEDLAKAVKAGAVEDAEKATATVAQLKSLAETLTFVAESVRLVHQVVEARAEVQRIEHEQGDTQGAGPTGRTSIEGVQAWQNYPMN